MGLMKRLRCDRMVPSVRFELASRELMEIKATTPGTW